MSWLDKKIASLKHAFSVFKKIMNILLRIAIVCFCFSYAVETLGFEIAFYIFTRIFIIVILIRGICSLFKKLKNFFKILKKSGKTENLPL